MDLNRWYHPLTATPFRHDCTYREAAPVHTLLRPWVRCLWGGTATCSRSEPHPVIPDTCTDIIFRIRRKSGSISSAYCALNDQTFFSASSTDPDTELFAIRFYPWASQAFMQDSLRGSLNIVFDAGQHFPLLVRQITQVLNETKEFAQRCERTEAILLSHLSEAHLHPGLLNAMADLLQNEGRMRISALAAHNQLSTRQLERLFEEYTGASPKKLNDMIRYQSVWREAVSSPVFDAQDAVVRYGYSDQSHMLRQFRQYHGMTLSQAIAYAQTHVGFIQYSDGSL